MSHILEIRLFGHPAVRRQGQPLDPKLPHKALALLYYLALAEQPVARATLAMLLWPAVPLPMAKQSLRNVLAQLRPALGDALAINQRTVSLSNRQQVDVVAFQQGLVALQQTPAPDLAVWQATLDLYRGEFLAGFYIQQAEPFAEWLTQHRATLRQQLITNLLALSAAYAASAASTAALACLDRLLAIEPDHEAASMQQIQLLLSTGRRTEARQRYERYRQRLADEFGLQPAPALTALLMALPTQEDAGGARPPTHGIGASPHLPTLPNNLARPLSLFVGRSQEVAHLCQRLTDPDCRLLTLVGPGGMGKTSLAQAVGQQLLQTQPAAFADGIYFVALADVGAGDRARGDPAQSDDPALGEAILRAIAEQIGYPLEARVAAAVQLQTHLRTRWLLLILDNFEQLLAGTDAVVTLLAQAPHLKLLITSRARLQVRGESVLTLDKLSLPTAAYHAAAEAAQANPAYAIPAAVWQNSEAVAMFVQRAQLLDPAFTLNAATLAPVGQICHLVEGLPLGIELATSLLPLLNCSTLAQDLARSLDVLVADTYDLPQEQRTLRAVFERSWRLLAPEAQRLLARLSIFPGSFRRDAAEQIVGASLAQLHHLLSQSLLSKAGEGRYTLHRTVHAFARQKLEQWPEQPATLPRQYAHFYLAFLARLATELTGAAYATVTAEIRADLDNVRTAWRWGVAEGNIELLALGVGSLQDFYRTAGIYPEAIQLLETALPVVRQAVALNPTATGAERLLARLLCYTAQFYRLYRRSGEVKKAESWANEALELGRQVADPALQALAYHELARLAQTRVDFAAMRKLAEQACIYGRAANLPHLIAENLNDLGIGDGVHTHPLAGIPHFQAALAYLQGQPNRTLEARIVSNLGLFYLVGHDYQSAHRYLQQARSLHHLLPDQDNSLLTLVSLGDLWLALGDYDAAHQEYRQGLALVQDRPAAYWESWLRVGYGRWQRRRGELAAAHATGQLALQIAQKDKGPTEVQWALIELGHVLTELGDWGAAHDCYQQAIALPKQTNWFFRTPDAHAGLAALALAQNDVPAALPPAEAALALLTQQGLAAAGEPFAVYWTCVRVLDTAGDPRAHTVLATAYQALQQVAQQLADARLRCSILENVVVNRNLVAAAQAAGMG